MAREAHLQLADFSPNRGLYRSSVAELWHVTGITGWNADNTSSAVFDAIPRTEGQAHPDITEAICTNFSLRKKINTSVFDSNAGSFVTEAFVVVFFGSTSGEVIRQRSSSTRGFTSSVQCPNWTRTSVGGTSIWTPTETSIPREQILRVETRYLRNGSLNDAAREQMFSRVGTVFRFPDNVNGIPHVLKSPSIVDYAPGLSRLVYLFETSCRLQPIAAGTMIGQDLALPALDYLQEYYAPRGSIGNDPIAIQPFRWQDRLPLSIHANLPFLT